MAELPNEKSYVIVPAPATSGHRFLFLSHRRGGLWLSVDHWPTSILPSCCSQVTFIQSLRGTAHINLQAIAFSVHVYVTSSHSHCSRGEGYSNNHKKLRFSISSVPSILRRAVRHSSLGARARVTQMCHTPVSSSVIADISLTVRRVACQLLKLGGWHLGSIRPRMP